MSKLKKAKLSQDTIILPQSIVPHTRVFVAVDESGKIISSRIVPYIKGEDTGQYYQRLSKIGSSLGKSCKKEAHSCRVYSGTADSVDSFLTLFPEIARPIPH